MVWTGNSPSFLQLTSILLVVIYWRIFIYPSCLHKHLDCFQVWVLWLKLLQLFVFEFLCSPCFHLSGKFRYSCWVKELSEQQTDKHNIIWLSLHIIIEVTALVVFLCQHGKLNKKQTHVTAGCVGTEWVCPMRCRSGFHTGVSREAFQLHTQLPLIKIVQRGGLSRENLFGLWNLWAS